MKSCPPSASCLSGVARCGSRTVGVRRCVIHPPRTARAPAAGADAPIALVDAARDVERRVTHTLALASTTAATRGIARRTGGEGARVRRPHRAVLTSGGVIATVGRGRRRARAAHARARDRTNAHERARPKAFDRSTSTARDWRRTARRRAALDDVHRVVRVRCVVIDACVRRTRGGCAR